MLTAMGDVMREAYRRGWISTRDGNISIRMGKFLYITPSGVRKNKIEPEHIIKIPISDSGELHNQEGASIELDMHWKIQQQENVKAVVHLHPTHIVGAMHAGFNLQDLADTFIELGRYTSVGFMVPQYPPGSNGLAQFTADYIKEHDVVGQIGHGVTAKAKDPWTAFEHIERLEHICQIVLASGVKPR